MDGSTVFLFLSPSCRLFSPHRNTTRSRELLIINTKCFAFSSPFSPLLLAKEIRNRLDLDSSLHCISIRTTASILSSLPLAFRHRGHSFDLEYQNLHFSIRLFSNRGYILLKRENFSLRKISLSRAIAISKLRENIWRTGLDVTAKERERKRGKHGAIL